MYTYTETDIQDITFVGMDSLPEFNITSRTDKLSYENIHLSDKIESLLNHNLQINNYSKSKIKHLTFVYIVIENTGKGVNWKERSYFDRVEKEFNLEIKLPNYQQFVTATKQEALRIMAAEILRGSEKFLKDEKDFDYNKFYSDVEKLFKDNNLL